MTNMSYCRYRNTLRDLGDCADDMEERLHPRFSQDDNDMPCSPLSKEEAHAAKKLLLKCLDIVNLAMEETGIEDLEDLEQYIEKEGFNL